MEPETLTLQLPPPMLAALRRIAAEDDVSVGQGIRAAIARDLTRRSQAKMPVRADERLVAPLRALLADDFAYAKTWGELQSRIAAKGYGLAESGGGLILFERNSGMRMCKGSELGYGYASLLRRFKIPFPGPASRWRPGLVGVARAGARP